MSVPGEPGTALTGLPIPQMGLCTGRRGGWLQRHATQGALPVTTSLSHNDGHSGLTCTRPPHPVRHGMPGQKRRPLW